MRIGGLLSSAVVVILLAACTAGSTPGVPGAQAVATRTGAGERIERPPVEILIDGVPQRVLQYDDLRGLPERRFGTGREDVQVGYALDEVLAHLGIESGRAVTLYGVGLTPVTLAWDEVATHENQVLLGLTHKGTMKVVAGNSVVLNRDGWVRHLTRIDVRRDETATAADGRIAETGENPMHPRKKAGGGR